MTTYLADRRKALGKTQKEIADYVGVSEATVSRWESGDIANMRRDKIKRYAEILETSTNFIMTGEETNTPDEEKIKAAFMGGLADGLSPEEIDEYWNDARAYLQFKLANRKKKKE